jgi:hypothetical protein
VIHRLRFLGLTPDGRARYAADYEADLRAIAGGPDPSCDDQVAVSADDTYELESTGAQSLDAVSVRCIANVTADGRLWGGARFRTGPFPAQGSIIGVAYIEGYVYDDVYGYPDLDIYAEAGGSPLQFSATAFDLSSRTRTNASAPWVADGIGTGWKQSPSIVALIQEVVDTYTPTAIVLVLKPRTDALKVLRFRSWDYDVHALGVKLHLEWTEGGPPVGQPTMRRWGGVPGMVYTGRAGW